MTTSSRHNQFSPGSSSSNSLYSSSSNSSGSNVTSVTNNSLTSSASSDSSLTNRSMVAREGRENQVYTSEGARVVAGTVVINSITRQILLITSSSRPNKFVIPKGGVELDERLDYRVAALRETWEEAGVYASSPSCLGPKLGSNPIANSISHHVRPQKPSFSSKASKCEYHFYELDARYAKIEDHWPEGHKRKRVWVTPEDALIKLQGCKKPELVEAVKRCSLFSN